MTAEGDKMGCDGYTKGSSVRGPKAPISVSRRRKDRMVFVKVRPRPQSILSAFSCRECSFGQAETRARQLVRPTRTFEKMLKRLPARQVKRMRLSTYITFQLYCGTYVRIHIKQNRGRTSVGMVPRYLDLKKQLVESIAYVPTYIAQLAGF